jgi:hypothetical protein
MQYYLVGTVKGAVVLRMDVGSNVGETEGAKDRVGESVGAREGVSLRDKKGAAVGERFGATVGGELGF